MTWIRTLAEDEVTGPLKARYEADLAQYGVVLEVTKALSACPPLALALGELKAAAWAGGGLAPRERNLIQFVVADRIDSPACTLLYATTIEREFGGPTGLRAVLADYRQAGLSEREIAILDYAVAVATGQTRAQHVTRLRDLGLGDAAILEVAFAAAFRLFGSRLYQALGVEIESILLEQTDLVEALTPGLTADPSH